MEDKTFELMTKMYQEVMGIKEEITGIKSEVSGIKSEVSGIKGEVSGIKGEVSGIKCELGHLTTKVDTGFEKAATERKDIKQDIAKLEYEVSNKFGALFDAREVLTGSSHKVATELSRVNSKLDILQRDMNFFSHKETETEKDVFEIKKHLEIIK